MNWKPYTAVALALIGSGITNADWEATGLDDNGWFEYRVKEDRWNQDRATIEYYHYGTGETQTIWLERDDDNLDYWNRYGCTVRDPFCKGVR
jgi:hypothetical protein